MNPKISVCIIVKNEEAMIENCIKSVLPVCYEIIVLDTGSTDKTIEICKRFDKVKLYSDTWENDFSKARNKCAYYATGDWILRVDADERLTPETHKNLLPFLINNSFDDNPVVLHFKILEYDPSGTFITSYFKNYLYRNNLGIKFMLPLHENLYCQDKNIIHHNTDFLSVFHLGESETNPIILNEKKLKYINQLLELINTNKDKSINYYYYRHLGDEYFDTKQHKEALSAYMLSYQEIKDNNIDNFNFSYSVINRIIKELIFFHKDYNNALYFIEEELKFIPNSIEGLFHLGYCKNRLNDIDKGIQIQKKALELIEENQLSRPIIANLCVEIGRFDNDVTFLLRANKIFPNSVPIIRHIIRVSLYNNDIEKTKYFFSIINKLDGLELNNNILKDKATLFNLLIKELNKEESWEKHELYFINKLKSIHK